MEDGTEVQTCPAALGYSFAAGTTDGPGAFDFTQGDSGEPDASPVWAVIKSLLRIPTAEQKKCQEPKPVLLDVGEQTVPYDWSPNIINVQLLRVGQLVIVCFRDFTSITDNGFIIQPDRDNPSQYRFMGTCWITKSTYCILITKAILIPQPTDR